MNYFRSIVRREIKQFTRGSKTIGPIKIIKFQRGSIDTFHQKKTRGILNQNWRLYGATTATVTSVAYLTRDKIAFHEPYLDFSSEKYLSSKYFTTEYEKMNFWLSDKSLVDLIRSAMVLGACKSQLLVERAGDIITIAKAIKLTEPIFWIIKHTFFKQFCGGENQEEIIPTVNRLSDSGISSILDLSIEADIDTDQKTYKDLDLDDRANQVVCWIKDSIEAASLSGHGNFVAVKLTALGSTDALLHSSAALSFAWDSFNHYDFNKDGKLDQNEFRLFMRSLPGMDFDVSHGFIDSLFKKLDENGDGLVDWVEMSDLYDILSDKSHLFFLGQVEIPDWCDEKVCSVSAKFRPELIRDDLTELRKISSRLDSICAFAEEKNVQLMIDAEQTYFQPAIDLLAQTAMRKYNKAGEKPFVLNTYQLYLKDGLRRLQLDFERSRVDRKKFGFGAKLVRGAYMVSERQRADILKIRSPIQDKIELTHADYNEAIYFLLQKVASENSADLFFVIASHNWKSIDYACKSMKSLGIKNDNLSVYFAQLYGMHDVQSYKLSDDGYNVSKYIAYGPVKDVIPYLLRRARENKSVLSASSNGPDDFILILDEIKSRLMFHNRKFRKNQENFSIDDKGQ